MAAISALPMVLVTPALLGSTRFCVTHRMAHTCPYNCLAVLDLATAVCLGPRLPICNSKQEVGMVLTVSFDELVSWPYRHRWGGRWTSPRIWMRVNCVGHQKECHGGQRSSTGSVGIECYSPRRKPFSLEWRVSITAGSSSTTVMLRCPGQAQGGQQQGGGPRIKFLRPGWRKRCPLLVGVYGRLFP
eukprot:1118333-Pelagomonas_calceolata.AAC.2